MRKKILHFALILVGFSCLGLFLFGGQKAEATNPNLINFQGKVVNADGTNVTNGTYSFNFVLFDDPTLGSESDGVHDKWHELSKSVDVTNGVFQTELGSATTLPDFSQFSALYLGVKFNSDSAGYMTPRIHLDSVPYAMYSDNSGALGGLTAANFVQLAQGLQTDSSTTNASIAINKNNSSGTPNILQLQKSSTNVMVLDNNGLLTLQPAASLVNGQSEVAQTFTAANATASGVVNGYNQAITVSNTTAGTTNGLNISLTDNTALANINKGLNIGLAGSNNSQAQYGVNVTVNHGAGIRAVSTGGGALVVCGSTGSSDSIGICAEANSTTGNAFGVEGYSSNNSNGTHAAVQGTLDAPASSGGDFYGLRGFASQSTITGIGNSYGVYGNATEGSGGKAYGGYFTLAGNSSTTGSAIFGTNGTSANNILQLQDATGSAADVFVVGDNGLISLQPAAALTGTGTQSNVSQILTNNQTGGTVNGYSQSITVSNASGTTTTNGFNISLADNSTLLGNTNKGISIAFTGSNAVQKQLGIDISNNKGGIGVRAVVSGSGGVLPCANNNAINAALCGDSSSGPGLYARTPNTNNTIADAANAGVYGTNTANTILSQFATGVKGIATGTGTAGTAIGVYGQGNQAAGATIYGGYFALGSGGATAGAALYATNNSVAGNILDLQDGTGSPASVFTVGDGGLITSSSNSASGLKVVDSSNSHTVISVDTSGDKVLLGQASAGDGLLIFNNHLGSNTVGFSLQANPVSSYTLLLPTTGPSVSQCLQTDGTTANQLVFSACTTGGSGATSVAYSSTANSNGGSITGSVLTLAKANGSNPGLLSADAQTIGGNKTFTGSSLFSNTVAVQTSSSSALQVQNANAVNIAAISTISLNQNLIANPSFESNTIGWSGYGAGGVDTLTTVTTAAAVQSGSRGLQDVTTATAGRGVKYIYNFKPNTAYTFSIYAAVSSGSTGAFFDIGRYENNVATTTSCPTTQTLTTALTRFTCSFTTGGTINGATDGPFARYTDATNAYTLYFDAAQLELAGSATTFVDQNYPNLVANSDFETGTNGWTIKGGATISSSDNYADFGNRSLKIVTAGGASDGASYAFPLQASSTYTLSFWARSSSSTYSITPGRQDISGTDADCSTSSISTTWTQFSCTFTTGSTITAPTTIYFKDAAAHTTYIDGTTLVSGSSGQSFIQKAASLQADPLYGNFSINNSNIGEIQSWQLNSNSVVAAVRTQASVVANGYIYSIGGINGSGSRISSIYYAELNADGSTGAWTTNKYSLPAALDSLSAIVSNDYLYAIGGSTASSQSTVYYAKLNADGSTRAWQTSANSLPAAISSHTSVVSNGYVYAIGGNSGAGSISTVYYAKMNADGSTGAWQTSANSIPARASHTSVAANGYVYAIGGVGSLNALQSTVLYAKLNADGSTGAWITNTNPLPDTRYTLTSLVANGYIYAMGGSDSSGNSTNTVYYAKLNADGSTGAWITSSSNLPGILRQQSSVQANGYFYLIGGFGNSAQSSVYYTSTSRLTVGGSLDLVGLSGQTAGDPGNNGGSLTAGNTSVLGALDVRDQANFTGSVGIGGALNVAGGATIAGASGSTNIFEVQNSGGINLANYSTVNLITNSSFEAGPLNVDNSTDGWSKKLGSETSIKNQTTAPQFGSRSLEAITTTTAQQGVKSVVPLIASTQYTLSFYAKVSSGSFATLTFGRSDTGSGETDCITTGSITTSFTRFTCTFTTGSGAVSGSYIYISKGTDTTARTIYIDGVQLEAAAAATDYRNGDFSVDSLATFKSTANSTTALQVQNSSGTSIINVDTTKSNSNNLISNSSFESAVSNWSLIGSANAPTQSGTQSYEGTNSLLIPTTGSNGGAKYTTGSSFLSSNTTYTLSAYVKTDSNLLVKGVFQMGRMDDGSTASACVLPTNTGNGTLPISGGWKWFTCTFKTGTVSSSPAIFFMQSDSVSRNLFIDDVLLQTDDLTAGRNSDTNYRNGAINFTGAIINGAVVLQNAVNSSNALEVQNASGSTIFNIDTTSTNLISNPGLEKDGSGWSSVGASTVAKRTSQFYNLGSYSYDISINNNTGGAQFSLNPIVTAISVGYLVSFDIYAVSGVTPTLQVTYSPDGTFTSDTCNPSGGTITSATWVRLYCTITADGSTTPTTGGYLKIAQTNSNISEWAIDNVQMESGVTAPTAYGAGAFSLNGVITSPVIIRDSQNSTNTFQVQNSVNISIINVDTGNYIFQVGTSISHSQFTGNIVVFGLDDYSGTDPTGNQAFNGAMYYSAGLNKFRCYENGAWTNCITTITVPVPNYLASNPTQTNGGGTYTTLFTIPLTASKMNLIQVHLIQHSSATTVGVRNRARIDTAGQTGNCTFDTLTSTSAMAFNVIAVGTAPADTATTAAASTSDYTDTIECAVTATSTPGNLIIEFTAETTGTVTTTAGSYYTNAVN